MPSLPCPSQSPTPNLPFPLGPRPRSLPPGHLHQSSKPAQKSPKLYLKQISRPATAPQRYTLLRPGFHRSPKAPEPHESPLVLESTNGFERLLDASGNSHPCIPETSPLAGTLAATHTFPGRAFAGRWNQPSRSTSARASTFDQEPGSKADPSVRVRFVRACPTRSSLAVISLSSAEISSRSAGPTSGNMVR